jgi:kinesin family protein 6/9
MLRLSNDYKHRGILPRIISKLFKDIHHLTEKEIKVKISYIEIYNETINDLLRSENQPNILLQEDPVYGVICKGAIIKEVSDLKKFIYTM